MPRYRDEPSAIRVYTVCDESKFLIVRNVPALGCGDDLAKLFSSYGKLEECKPMDAEDCEPFTDVYWVKFQRIDNARYAKRKLDEFVFLGNRIQVSYAPQYESLSDTKEKLEVRRREVLTRPKSQRCISPAIRRLDGVSTSIISSTSSHIHCTSKTLGINQSQFMKSQETNYNRDASMSICAVSTEKEYFPSQSMNQTVQFVRDKLSKIKSSAEESEAGTSKKARVDNRRRI
ncbi:unnamed protein product [Cuscuta epithymum]|uniref:RNA-binding protein 48 n=1 Tax=Cuscuta epithymum TaxID=186058 RepID=A0AAV0DES7_9ASTE|nr:unnamed protein product [Cuscuta epithymum]CAH9097133.1 unnamed protein product [Cuscuta epithymum]